MRASARAGVFPYALLHSVAAVADGGGPLGEHGEREAGLDSSVGPAQKKPTFSSPRALAPQATYRFKHALIQDAAYESLLKSRRQTLHRRAAEILRDIPERAAAEPEAIAHHFTQAGLDDLAVEWWGKAADQALRRSAFQEAIAHLGKAIEMADKSAGATSRPGARDAAASSQRLKLQTDYGQAVMWSKGFAAAETKTAFSRVRELAGKTDDFSVRSAGFDGQCRSAMIRGELQSAWQLASSFLHEAEETERPAETRAARRSLGMIAYFRGDFLEARTHLERALDACNAQRQEEAPAASGDDIGAVAMSYLALTSWQLGEVGRARELIDAANRRAEEIGHVPSRANPLYWKSYLEILRGDPLAALRAAEALAALAQAHAMMHFTHLAELNIAWAHGRLLHDPTASAEQFRQALKAHLNDGFRVGAGFCTGLLAELEAETLGAESALARIDEALDLLRQADYRFDLPYLFRIRGNILLRSDSAHPVAAEDAYQAAIAIAKQQGARSHVLLASLSLAKLYQSSGSTVDAHSVLAPALEGFAPTPEMPEIAEAQSLLGALAETDEVKSAEAQRHRRLHLQTAYGQAMMWVKGFSDEEARAAFSRATELAAKTDNFTDRFAAAHFQWILAFLRGELRSARDLGLSFLKEAQETGFGSWKLASPGVASPWPATRPQDFTEARIHCERALETSDLERDRETQERFHDATGPIVMSILAVTMWQLGEVDRARELIEQANRRGSELGHGPSMAHPLFWKSRLEIQRGDAAAALSAAEALDALGSERGTPFWCTDAKLSAAWARGRRHSAAAGAEDLRRALRTASTKTRGTTRGFSMGCLRSSRQRRWAWRALGPSQ